MIELPDFKARKIILVYPQENDIMAVKNDNFIVVDKDNKIKLQISCYRIFAIYIIGGFTITTGVIEKSKKYGFSVLLFKNSFRLYETINFQLEGNTLLHYKQYTTGKSIDIAKNIIINKISNQKWALIKMRDSNNKTKINLLDDYIDKLKNNKLDINAIMGIEGMSAKIYFKTIFQGMDWHGRQPRVKRDKLNLLLDIGYTILFNYIEGILNLYGFDLYKGNLHQEFYKRKSLVCDIIEPFRPIIDYKIRKAYNLKQLNYKYIFIKNQYNLNWQDSSKFIKAILEDINDYQDSIFKFIQKYYRWFMKDMDIERFPKAELKKNDNN